MPHFDLAAVAIGILTVTNTLLVATFAFLAKNTMDRLKSVEEKRDNLYLAHRQAQITDLFVPLSQRLGRRRTLVELYEKQSTHEAKHYIERTFIDPVETDIASLIESKAYLFPDGKLLQPYVDFLKYATAGMTLGQLWDKTGIDNMKAIPVEYPKELDSAVDDELKRLMAAYSDYLNQPSMFIRSLPAVN